MTPPAHRLLLVRHAEAAHGLPDEQRPLTARGERQAAAIGPWLADAGQVPDRVVVSPARRAVQTWEGAAGSLPTGRAPSVDERIYDNTVEDLLAVVRETSEEIGTLALVGHNPSMGELAALLDDGRGDGTARRDVGDGFPTGAVAVLTVDGPFADVEPGTARLVGLARPGG